jgi:hypothetical protein
MIAAGLLFLVSLSAQGPQATPELQGAEIVQNPTTKSKQRSSTVTRTRRTGGKPLRIKNPVHNHGAPKFKKPRRSK